jgi:hypothetical protein
LNKRFYPVIAPAGKRAAGTLPVEVILAQLPNSSGRTKSAGMENRFYKYDIIRNHTV